MDIPRLETLEQALSTIGDQHPFVIDGLLPMCGMSLIVAHPKAGKSTLVRNMALSVARGHPFLGRPTIQGTVLYYILEEIRQEALLDFHRMGAATEPIKIRAGPMPLHLIQKTLKEDIITTQATLVIIDPLFDAIAVEDVNNYGPMNRAMKDLLYVARNQQTHILTCHHTNKMHMEGGGLAILGSQALRGATDANLFLTRRPSGARYFETEQRGSGVPFESTKLHWNPDTHIVTLGEPKKDTRARDLATKILDIMDDKELTTSEIYDMVKGKSNDKGPALNLLLEEGKLSCRKDGRTTLWRKQDASSQ